MRKWVVHFIPAVLFLFLGSWLLVQYWDSCRIKNYVGRSYCVILENLDSSCKNTRYQLGDLEHLNEGILLDFSAEIGKHREKASAIPYTGTYFEAMLGAICFDMGQMLEIDKLGDETVYGESHDEYRDKFRREAMDTLSKLEWAIAVIRSHAGREPGRRGYFTELYYPWSQTHRQLDEELKRFCEVRLKISPRPFSEPCTLPGT